MSNDYQFVSVVDDLQITLVEDVDGAEPRTLRIVGRGGFVNTQRVTINDYVINGFELVSDRVLLVVVPAFLQSLAVRDMDVVAISSALTGTRRARLLLGPTKRTKRVSGLQKLVQQVLKETLARSGSNKFNTSTGGNLPAALGETLNPEGKARISSSVSQAVERVKAQFLAAQVNDRTLAASERLLEYRMERLDFEANRAVASLRLQTYSGLSIDIPLEL